MKRILCFCLMIVMIFNVFSVVYANEAVVDEGVVTSSDAELNQIYLEEYKLLESIEVIEFAQSVNYDGTTELTRAEAASIAARLKKMNDFSEGVDTGFSDVVPDNLYAGSIMQVTTQGIMSGTNGNFRPDDPISVNEFVTVLIRILGYDDYVQKTGGYPVGYLNLAERLDIFSGVDVSGSDITTYDTAVKMVHNTLEAPVLKISSISGDVVNYVKNKDNVLMNEYLNVYYNEGVVTSNENATLYNNATTSSGYVAIDGIVYETGDIEAEIFLGHKVRYYYEFDQERGIRELKYIADDDADDIIVLKHDEIIDFKNNIYTYYQENSSRRRTVSVEKNIKVLYNGAIIESGFTKYVPTYGNVELINNDDDSSIDFVVIHDYTFLIVGDVSLSEDIVYSKNDGKLSMKFDDDSRVFDSSNKEMDFAGLKKDMLLMAEIKQNNYVYRAFISQDTIIGRVAAISDKEVVLAFDESEVAYKLGECCKNSFKANIQLNDTVKAFLYNNEIVAFEKTVNVSKLNIAYVIAGGVENEGFDDTVILRVLTTEGKVQDVNLSKKVKTYCLDKEVSYTDYNDLINNIKEKVIEYTIDSKGEIRRLDYSPSYSNAPETMNAPVLQTYTTNNTKQMFYPRALTTGGYTTFDTDPKQTIVFCVPEDRTEYESYNTADFGILMDEEYNIDVYRVGNQTLASNVIVCKDFGAASEINESNIMLVDEVHEAWIAAEEEVSYAIAGMINGEYMTIYVKEKESVDDWNIEHGDVIMTSDVRDGYVNRVVKRFDRSTNSIYTSDDPKNAVPASNPTYPNYDALYKFAFGTAYQKTDKYLSVYRVTSENQNLANATKDNLEYINLDKMQYVYVCDLDPNLRGPKVEVGTTADILDYVNNKANATDILICWYNWSHAQMAIIYK